MGDFTFPAMQLTGNEKTVAELSQPDERGFCDVEHLQAPFLHAERGLPAAVPEKLRQRITVARQLAVYGFFCYEFNAVSLFWSVSCIEMALKSKFEETHPGRIKLRRVVESVRAERESPAGDATPGGSTVNSTPGADMRWRLIERLEETCEVPVNELEDRFRSKWRIPEMKYFDYSFKALLTWAFRQGFLPEDIEIPLQEIINSYNWRFKLQIFPTRAEKEGLLGSNSTLVDIERCWASLTDSQRKHYWSKNSTVLIEELPKFRNMMAHPKWFNLVTPPRSPLSAYQLLIDIVFRLYSYPDAAKAEAV